MLAELLTMLMQKNPLFEWGDDQQCAFEVPKDRVCTTPVLEIYDGSVDTMLELHTDASAKALGAVLL